MQDDHLRPSWPPRSGGCGVVSSSLEPLQNTTAVGSSAYLEALGVSKDERFLWSADDSDVAVRLVACV